MATLVLFGFRLGVRPIKDNSMLTHLATGIEIFDRGAIPRIDPYSFTARGDPWMVQSWLPEWTYGLVHAMGGFRLVVLEQAILTALLAWLIVRLARAGSPLRTALAGSIAIGAGAAIWAPRPLMVGLICMALTVTVVEGRRSRWVLVPIVWLWVNSHGSFPLGLFYLGARAVGEAIDWRVSPRESLRYAVGFATGLAASVVNPLGARLLAFPLTVGQKQEAFDTIVEWGSPNFHRGGGLFTLAFLVMALALLFRFRSPWRDVVPVATFLGASLYSVRNLAITAVVLAPALARAVRRPDAHPSSGAARTSTATNLRLERMLLATILLGFVAFGASIFTTPGLELAPYPTREVSYLAREGLLQRPHRLAHQDFVGNYVTLRYGRRASVFIDDRYDMYPVSVSRDYRTLLRGGPESLAILDRYRIDAVLWDQALPLPVLLRATDGWAEVYRSADWVVLRRVAAPG